MKILIIDDDANTLENLKNILIPAGYEIMTTNEPENAFELFKNEFFDVVILDLKMYPVDGLTLLKLFRENNYTTYVIIITGFEEMPALEMVDKLKIQAILKKPLNIKILINELKEIEILRRYEQKMESDNMFKMG